MPSIAIIGPDGAGKTTVTRALETSGLLPFKYIYMGINTSSSNVALPSSRLVEWLKPHLRKSGGTGDSGVVRERERVEPPGRLWVAARLVNRVAEQWFRQLLSWTFELRGYVVLYDRHFLFDFADDGSTGSEDPLDRRIHRMLLERLYPRPNLVILLDAPGEVLFARKGESTPEELEKRRAVLRRTGQQLPNFIRVDATRPLNEVYEETAAHVLRFCGERASNPPAEAPQ
jgi:thymidylate kinase